MTQNRKAPSLDTGGPQEDTNDAIVARAAVAGKVATVKAQLGLHGFQVRAVQPGGFFVARWNHARYCADLGDLIAFATRVGAHRA